MKKAYLFLCGALALAIPASAAESIPSSPRDPASPRFEVEPDWNGELRPRYKGPQPEEPLSAPVITPEQPRIARRSEPAPKIEVWDEADVRPREREDRIPERRSAARERNEYVIEGPARDYSREDPDGEERAWEARARDERRRAAWERQERRRLERAWRMQEREEREMARRERYERERAYFDDYDDRFDRFDDEPYRDDYGGRRYRR
jgi:hypothetical protein